MLEPYDRYRNKAVVEKGADCLEVVPSYRAWARDALCAAAGAGALLLFGAILVGGMAWGGGDLFGGGYWWMWGFIILGFLGGAAALAAGILTYRSRVRVTFDRAAGTMTERRGKQVQTYPLAEVERVSLTKGGPYREEGQGLLGNVTVTYETAVLKMLFRDGRAVVLSNHTDLNWSKKAGRQLADFLHVPSPEEPVQELPQEPVPDSSKCPKCGFGFKWDGVRCGHCGFSGAR